MGVGGSVLGFALETQVPTQETRSVSCEALEGLFVYKYL